MMAIGLPRRRSSRQTSLPAALNVKLPSRGAVKISGQRYQVRAFTKHALNNEKVRVWVLLPG